MRIVESVLSPKPENANLRSSVLWSERNVRSLKPIQPEGPKRTSTLFNVLEGTVSFVRKNVLSLNTLSLFAGITCTVAVVLAVWAIYMFKEQKAKMRNLQNMVVDMSLNDAKQKNGGVSNIKTTTTGSGTSNFVPPAMNLSETPKIPFVQRSVVEQVPQAQLNQFDELRKVQQEVAKLLTNPLNIVMEAPPSTVTVEDITNTEAVSTQEINSLVKGTTDQKRRFESIISSYNVQMTEQPKVQPMEEADDGSDEDFLRDMELYQRGEESLQEDVRQLENDLQLAMSVS